MENLDAVRELVEELEDFDLLNASYQVWGFYLNKDQDVLTDVLLQEFDDPDDAVNYAKTFVSTVERATIEREGAAFYEVIVETVVDFDEYEENIATLFREIIVL